MIKFLNYMNSSRFGPKKFDESYLCLSQNEAFIGNV